MNSAAWDKNQLLRKMMLLLQSLDHAICWDCLLIHSTNMYANFGPGLGLLSSRGLSIGKELFL